MIQLHHGHRGSLQQFLYGYAGYRLIEADGVTQKYKPILLNSVRKLTLRNITIRGKKYDVVVERGKHSRGQGRGYGGDGEAEGRD